MKIKGLVTLCMLLAMVGCGGDSKGGSTGQGHDQNQDSVTQPDKENTPPTTLPLSMTYSWENQTASARWLDYADDLDGDTLFAEVIQQGVIGSFEVDGEMVKYTANMGNTGSDTGELLVSDGRGGTATMALYVDSIDGRDGVSRALETGDVSYITDVGALLNGVSAKMDALGKQRQQDLKSVFSSDPVEYTPPKSSGLFSIVETEQVFSLIQGSKKNRTLATAGRLGDGKFTSFGTKILSEIELGKHVAMDDSMKRLVQWLLPNQASSRSIPSVGLAFLAGETANVEDWLLRQFPDWAVTRCDTENYAQCFDSADVIFVGPHDVADNKVDPIIAKIEAQLNKGTGVFYQHQGWGENTFSKQLAQLFGYTMPVPGNYYVEDAADWSDWQQMAGNGDSLTTEKTVIDHFINQGYAFDWSGCVNSVGSVSCNDVDGFKTEFLDGANSLKSRINGYDSKGIDLFKHEGRELLKMLVLLGDKYRSQIKYPMDKETTDTNVFLQSYFADHTVYYHRDINPAQADLGNFSQPISEEALPMVENKAMVYTLSEFAEYQGTGLYVLPGQTVTVERLDGQDVALSVFVNTQRTGSSRVFNKDSYVRPKFLKSRHIALQTGSKATFTTPYGGPLMVQLPSGTGEVEFKVSNVTFYPYMSDLSESETYLAQLRDGPLSWTGIRTDFVEINSLKEMMLKLIDDSYQSDVRKALDDIWQYMIKGTYQLAGFTGTGLELDPAVKQYCQSLGWNCEDVVLHRQPKVQHINVDKSAHCGGACSGNPYDQAAPINPLGWGETHEIGHNLQRSRLNIYGGRSTEVSNNIFPMFKGWQYYRDHQQLIGSCHRNGNKNKQTYALLQQADDENEAYALIWKDSSYAAKANERLNFYWQIIMMADEQGNVGDGWNLYTMLYLQERLFNNAVKDEARWNQEKTKLGFANISHSDAKSMDGNDFMLIGLSYLLDYDFRPYFTKWGIDYTDEASIQVENFGHDEAPLKFYTTSDHCKSLSSSAIPLDGTTTWPTP